MTNGRPMKRKKEIRPAVLEALLHAARTNPPSVSQPFPPPTIDQIERVMNMTAAEQREYFKIGIAGLEQQRRRERHAKRNKGKSAA